MIEHLLEQTVHKHLEESKVIKSMHHVVVTEKSRQPILLL